MQQNQPKIELYRKRTFTQKLTDTFGFLRENWKPLTKYFIYIMLPLSIVTAFFANHFFNGYFSIIGAFESAGTFNDDQLIKFVLSTLAASVVGLLAYLVLIGLVYAMVRLYRLREDRLKNLSWAELKPDLWHCIKRSLWMTLAGLLILLVIIGIFVVVCWGLFSIDKILGFLGIVFLYVLALAIVLPMSLAAPAYMLEDDLGVFSAYLKGMRLGFATWGGVLAVTFVVGIITGVVQSFTMLPWYVLSLAKMLVTVANKQEGGFFNTSLFDFIQYLTCILSCLGYFVSAVITIIGLTIQYGHACDKIDGVGVARNIEKFDEFDNL